MESARDAVCLLSREASRSYMVVRDEVAFARSYNLIYGLDPESPQTAHVVGGAHPGMGKVVRGEEGFPLEKDRLAPISVSTCLKTIDKRTNLFQIQQIPRQRITNMDFEFQEIGLIMHW